MFAVVHIPLVGKIRHDQTNVEFQVHFWCGLQMCTSLSWLGVPGMYTLGQEVHMHMLNFNSFSESLHALKIINSIFRT